MATGRINQVTCYEATIHASANPRKDWHRQNRAT